MQRYARYWGEDDDERGDERGRYERGRERRGYGERGGWVGGREHAHWRGRPRDWREWREPDPYARDWRETEPYRRERDPAYREGWGERGYYGRGPRDEEMPRGWYGPRRERPPYGYGRPPMHPMHRGREPMGRWEERERWGEPRGREEEPGLMERIGEGIRSFFTGGGERGPHAGKGPKGYRRSDDRIREDVCDRIATWGWVDASDVEVRVQDGEVTLSGQVASRRDKRLLEEMIEDISGVIDVHNQVRVRRDVGQRPITEGMRSRSDA